MILWLVDPPSMFAPKTELRAFHDRHPEAKNSPGVQLTLKLVRRWFTIRVRGRTVASVISPVPFTYILSILGTLGQHFLG